MVPRSTLMFLWRRIEASATSLLVLVLAATLMTGIASAQNASLGGTVTDENGEVISDATVVATNVDTGIARQATTNKTGRYQFPSLRPGNYNVSAVSEGFTEVVYEPIPLSGGAQMRLNFTLTAELVPETTD